jgi:hypothetical protein
MDPNCIVLNGVRIDSLQAAEILDLLLKVRSVCEVLLFLMDLCSFDFLLQAKSLLGVQVGLRY